MGQSVPSVSGSVRDEMFPGPAAGRDSSPKARRGTGRRCPAPPSGQVGPRVVLSVCQPSASLSPPYKTMRFVHCVTQREPSHNYL